MLTSHAPPARTRSRDSAALLARYAEHRDPADLDELVRSFRPLVVKLALRYAQGSAPLDDLEQVASIGLIKAIQRFDPDKGFAFTSFAVPTILGELKRAFRDTAWGVHVPRALQEQVAEVRKASDAHVAAHGHAPTVAELAHRLERSPEDVVDALQAVHAMAPLSLDAPRRSEAEEEGSVLADAFGDEDLGFELVEHRAVLQAALRALTPRQREFIELRFGEGLKQSDIAARVGCSQMQVSRVLRAGLERLRTVAQHQSAVAA